MSNNNPCRRGVMRIPTCTCAVDLYGMVLLVDLRMFSILHNVVIVFYSYVLLICIN